MKELWSDNPISVQEELQFIVEKKIPVSFQTKKSPLSFAKISKIVRYENSNYLIFQRPETITNLKDIECVFFKVQDKPILSFLVSMTKGYKKLMASLVPEELYYIERRMISRCTTTEASRAFFLQGKRVHQYRLKDISLGGVRLHGAPVKTLSKADTIGPISFTFATDKGRIFEEMTIAISTVSRIVPINDTEVELGLTFDLSKTENTALSNFIAHLRPSSESKEQFHQGS